MIGLIVMAVALTFVGFAVALLRRLRKLVLTLHVGVSFVQDPGLRRSAYAFMHLYDLATMVPLGFLSLFTGVFLSVGTSWGLFTNVWVLEAARSTAADPGVDLGMLGVQVLANAVAFNLVFWTTTLSTVKPWGNTFYGRRQMVAQRSTVRPGRRAEQPQKKG